MTPAHTPLAGVRVLDFGCYIAGPLVGMLLADQGAEVIKVDPPGGPVFEHDVNAVLNRGKQRVSADLTDPADQARIADLIRGADIVIENFPPATREKLRLRAQDVHAINPDVIHVSLPGAAADDDLLGGADAFEGIVAAVTAQFTNIHAVREPFGLDPVYTPLPIASVYAGVHAATAVVVALTRRAEGYASASIEVPLVNAALSAMSSLHLRVERQPERYAALRLPTALRSIALPMMRRWAQIGGEPAQTKLLAIARKSYPALMTSYECADGRHLYLFAIDNGKIARAALEVLGLLDTVLAEGFVFAEPYAAGDRRDNLSEASNLSRTRQARLKALIAGVLRCRSATEWEAMLNARGVTCAVQRTTSEWLMLPQLEAAGLVCQLDDPELGQMRQPGPQAMVTAGPRRTRAPQPRYARVELAQARWSDRFSTPGPSSHSLDEMPTAKWLQKLLVVDLCSMVAGPVAGRVFAEYGARVIKVEPPLPNHGPRLTAWYGLDVNQGKESVCLDLKSLGGRDVLRRLLQRADILVTNHSPKAMNVLGFAEDALRDLNPRLITCRIGAYSGPYVGPWETRVGYDPVLQAAAGIMMRYGDPNNPELHAIASCVDALTGYSAAFGAAVALYAGGGSGCSVKTSLAAAATLVQLPFAFEHSALTRAEAAGQTAKGESDAYRLYRAKDGWIFLAAPRFGARAVAAALGVPDTNLVTIERAVARSSVEAALEVLQAAGISAVRVETIASLAARITGRIGQGIRLERHDLPDLGAVIVAQGQQVTSGGGLARLSPAQKPGTSTERIIREVGLDPHVLFACGAAAREISRDYLPA